ncbi:MAG: hypothetical protein IJ679_07870 [Lachnospiraceae bacterium]|nr:hypothetical protein [Lachnospiraceae bacterium]
MLWIHRKSILGVLLAWMLVFASPVMVYADGTTSIGLSQNSTEVGGRVTVTVSGTDSSTLSLRYNNEVFKFVSCSAAGATNDSNVVTFSGQSGQITLEAIGSGSGDLIVSSDTLSGSSVSVPVSGSAAPAESEEEEPESTEEEPQEEPEEEPEETSSEEETPEAPEETEEEPEEPKTPVKKSNASDGDGDYVIGGQEYVLSERFSESEIPDGYEKKTLHIHGGEYDELSNGVLTLVYLKPVDNIEGSGEFYIYDEDMDSVSKYAARGSSEYYMMVEKPSELPSDLLEKTKITVGGETFKVYQIGEEMTDFYFVYGTDLNGNTGWYSYDAAKETIQRANERLLEMASTPPQPEPEAQEEHFSMPKGEGKAPHWKLPDLFGSSRTLLAIGIFALVVVLVIILDVLLFRRRDAEDDFEIETDPEDYEPKTPPTVDKILEEKDFDEANKPHQSKRFFRRDQKSTDIWDTGEKKLSDTSELEKLSEATKSKKQAFRGKPADDPEEGKIDVIDFNDL